LAGLALAPPIAVPANAASSAGCEGGGFVISGLNDGGTVSTDGITTIPASNLGAGFLVNGTYVEFTVVSASFGVQDWTLTGAPNPLDITGNSHTVVFDSKAQVATRVQEPGCVNHIATRTGGIATVRHCGAISRWDVASGGRMGQVMGEDAVEVAPPATSCTQRCQARDRVRGGSVVLGFPFPVPQESRLEPLFPAP
jgi:hypothetical protein